MGDGGREAGAVSGPEGLLGAIKERLSEVCKVSSAPMPEPPLANNLRAISVPLMEDRIVRTWPTQGFRCFPTARAAT